MNRQVFSLDLRSKEESRKTGCGRDSDRSTTGLVGSVVTGRITKLKPLFAEVETDSGLLGQVHVTSMSLARYIGT